MRKTTLLILIAVSAFLVIPKTTYAAASLYLSPSNTNLTVGKSFQVTVFADSRGQDINTAEANLIFSTETLELVSVEQGSVFFLSTPASPNHTGEKIYLGGGLPNPGYKGNKGSLGTLTFKPKKAGKAWIKFDNGHVLLNDGAGTDVLSETHGADFNITLDTTPPAAFSVELVGEGDKEHASTTPTIKFETTDGESGLDHYEVYLNDELISDKAISPFTFDKQATGGYLIKVLAVDIAGNKTSSILPIVIPVLEPVVIEKPVETPATVGYVKRNVQYPMYALIFFNIILFGVIGGLLLRRRKSDQANNQAMVMREQRILHEISTLMSTKFTSFNKEMQNTIRSEIEKLEKRLPQKDEDYDEVTNRLVTLRRLQDEITDSKYTNWRGRKNPDNE